MNQYREGKAKRTPARGVKENLKPCTYKQWEPHHQSVSLCVVHKMRNVILDDGWRSDSDAQHNNQAVERFGVG